MRSLRLILSVVLLSLSTVAFAQSDAQKSFDKLKTLAGSWEGSMDGKAMHVSLRVTSMGNTLMHEMTVAGSADDPITMFNLDHERLLLTHYCDAGNQPRLVATVSPDGKTFTFDFVDATNLLSSQMGHMQHVVFNMVDADHHTELWQFAMANGKTEGGLLDLRRSK
jgi:hypothetical protein